jgi:hypothetical protein
MASSSETGPADGALESILYLLEDAARGGHGGCLAIQQKHSKRTGSLARSVWSWLARGRQDGRVSQLPDLSNGLQSR